MQLVHVELLGERLHLRGAAGVSVGDAGGQRVAIGAHRHQRGGEGVHADRGDRARQRLGEHGTESGAQLLDHLISVNGGGAVVADGEGVRLLVGALADLSPRRVIHASA